MLTVSRRTPRNLRDALRNGAWEAQSDGAVSSSNTPSTVYTDRGMDSSASTPVVVSAANVSIVQHFTLTSEHISAGEITQTPALMSHQFTAAEQTSLANLTPETSRKMIDRVIDNGGVWEDDTDSVSDTPNSSLGAASGDDQSPFMLQSITPKTVTTTVKRSVVSEAAAREEAAETTASNVFSDIVGTEDTEQ